MRLNNTMEDCWERHEAPLDDKAMGQHMRALAVSLTVDARAALSTGSRQAFSALVASARRLAAETETLPSALEWLCENGRLTLSYMEGLLPREERTSSLLPAQNGCARIERIVREIARHSDSAVSAQRLMDCLTAFDEVRALEMNELWAVPSALAIVLMQSCMAAGRRAVTAQSDRIAAVRWVDGGADLNAAGLINRSTAFFEGALHHMREQDLTDAQAALKAWLSERDRSAEALCAIERERQSLDRLQLDHALATLRMLSALDWSKCFGAVSRTEQTLLKDPSGTYPRLDEVSRAQIRGRIVALSRHSDIGENTFAAAALVAAENDSGLRREITWWLGTDEGTRALLRGMGVQDARVPRLHPDPQARIYRTVLILVTLAMTLLLAVRFGIWGMAALPAVMGALGQLLGRLAAGMAPRRLMRYKLERLPEDMRTLVIVPALMTSPERARELACELEVLGCLEDDPMLTFALLGDLPDADEAVLPGDQAILEAAALALSEIDARGGRPGKYRLLTRRREAVPGEGRFSGRERKRGAINALMNLLCGGDNVFEQAEGADLADAGYAFVVTLDAGGRMLPGTIHALVSTLALPINRARYAVLAPRMALTIESADNRFVRLMAGRGGMDGYSVSQSDLWQDLSGEGSFGGKGILDVRAFHAAMEQAQLPENRILSHDLLEGLFAGAGFVNDIVIYEGHPRRVRAWLERLHRWTRGDWQLLPFAFDARLSGLDRWKLAGNWLRSLETPSALLSVLAALGLGAPILGLAGLSPLLVPFLTGSFTRENWERFVMRLSLWPEETRVTLDALIRALYRQFISRRHLLEWVTADEAERRSGQMSAASGWMAAGAALLGAVIQPGMLLPASILAALWATAAQRSLHWEQTEDEAPTYTDAEKQDMRVLAHQTWRFFSDHTPQNGLTPDNVQLDPPRGAAQRTSPTNIALYMLSCVSAAAMGLIGEAECAARLERTAETLERLDKWHGQFYNWYDIGTEKPLPPRYVSSVDSGNLAAALLTCAMAVKPPLAQRLEALARGMDLAALYDPDRELFCIGIDTDSGRCSESHYDLLASEARILSMTAMMLGQVPVRHFAHLGRSCTRLDEGGALISWSGTMFEYLMPCLLMPIWPDTLLGESCKNVIRAQKAAPARPGMPWGISESGLYAFDRQLNYQYRAFGLPSSALRGDCEEGVIAPYASALALPFDRDAFHNIAHMRALGWADEHGLFEAADFDVRRIPQGAGYRLIRSHMAHHQGMILCSLCNVLEDNLLIKLFMARPQAQALKPLLQEKAPDSWGHALTQRQEETPYRAVRPIERAARPLQCDAHIMHGGETTLIWTAQGTSRAASRGILLNAPRPDEGKARSGFYVHLRAKTFSMLISGGDQSPARQSVRFSPGCVTAVTENDAVRAQCMTCVSPEDGAVIQHVTLENRTDAPLDVEVTGCTSVALARESDYRAHPAFWNLFVESDCPRPGVLTFKRRPRAQGEIWPRLVYMAHDTPSAALSWESDEARLTGREGAMADPGALAEELSGTVGHTLLPCAAIRLKMRINPGERRETGFAAGLSDEEKVAAFIARHDGVSGDERAGELAATQGRALMRHLAVPAGLYALFDRAAALMGKIPIGETGLSNLPEEDLTVRSLWPLGLSGDGIMVTGFCRSLSGVETARELLKMYDYHRAMGLEYTLILVNDYGNDYDCPVQTRLETMLAAESVRPVLLDGARLTKDQRRLLRMASALVIDCDLPPLRAQLKAALEKPVGAAMPENITPSQPLEKRRALEAFNGWGGFEGDSYVIERTPTPAPWCNILCNEHFGSMVTECGGSFTWLKNSREGRLTPFDNDALHDSPGERMILSFEGFSTDPEGRAARVTHTQGESLYEGRLAGLSWQSAVFVDCEKNVKAHIVTIKSTLAHETALHAEARVEWIMGVFREDARFVRQGTAGGVTWARGQIGAAAFMTFIGAQACAPSGVPVIDMRIPAGGEVTLELILGCADTKQEIDELLAEWTERGGRYYQERTRAFWQERLSRVEIETPDVLLNAQINRFLPYQVMCGRLWGRAGYYQAGGAFGFRDQLQDQLSQIPTAPGEVRAHILECAAHQFEGGDVQHWWHAPYRGVRTRISDDMLFLPYVTGHYVRETGDRGILDEEVPFLKDEPIPQGREDWYGEAQPGSEIAALREHCMRAIDRAMRCGEHGLLLMGTGDWNDGMNAVGRAGRGESVWLSEFMLAVIAVFAPCCEAEEAKRLNAMALRLREAIERAGWDEGWYLRAYDDGGMPLGGQANSECRIDSLPQSWAVLAGLDSVRASQAMDAVCAQLIDREHGLIRLLTPPFDGVYAPGYIRSYPPGIRENGGQYTHAACWVVLALAMLGRGDQAWEAARMLLPVSHGDTREKEEIYRVEPYVMAGDVYDGAAHAGRGGWTWYTGAAGWMLRAVRNGLCGLVWRGGRVSMRSLLPEGWDSIGATIRVGGATYMLLSTRECERARLDGEIIEDGFIDLIDDGAHHRAVFPARMTPLKMPESLS